MDFLAEEFKKAEGIDLKSDKQAMQRFTRQNVVELTKNYSDGEYDTYTLKVKKDPSTQDYDY